GAPQPELALPGPVRGRVAQLPDGRLLYGRARSPKQTDLVLFDPDYPTQEPEPVLALSSAGHDLAPVVTDDGTCTVWFASDRGGGAGGFDLYRARYRQGIFYGLAPLDLPGVNTAFDETDPAPDPQGQQLVFVRRDPGFREGRNATLWIASLAGAFDPRLLFAPDQHTSQHTARGPLPPLDRDPAFSARGKALYFVRQQPLEAPVLMQTFLHRGRFVAPLPVDITPGRTAMRGPVLLAGGFDLRLVASASAEDEAVVYRSRAREVRPYWDGQRWIEHLLVSLVFVFLTLLVLLTLGARWHQLDLITKLFLLSVAVHLLMLLWLSRMEIVRSFFPDQPKPGPRDVEVTLLAAAGNRTTGTDAVVAQTFDVSHETEFSPRESALDATAPGGEVLRQERRFAPANTPRAELRPTATSPSRTVVEPVPAVETRSGRSEQAVVAATKIPKTRMRPQQIAARQRQQQQQPRRPIEVTVPGTDVPRTSPKARPHPDAGTLAAAPPPRPTPNPPRADAPRLQDAPAQAAARTQAAEPGTRIKPPVTAVPTPAVAVLKPDARRPGSENPARDLDVRPAGSLVARKQDRAAAPAMPSGPTSPLHLEPRPMAAGAAAVALNDALRTRTPTPATTATPTQGIPTDETPPSAHLGDVAQARADTDRTAPQHNPSNATPMTTPGGPASPSLVASPTRRAQPSELAPTPTRTPTPTRRVFADLAELDDVPEHAGSIAVPTKTGSSAAKASAPVLPDLVPQRSGLIPPRRHHSRPGTRIGSAPDSGFVPGARQPTAPVAAVCVRGRCPGCRFVPQPLRRCQAGSAREVRRWRRHRAGRAPGPRLSRPHPEP
ncbi:MAG: TolB family protein, partial [Planctomycetota bacterium]